MKIIGHGKMQILLVLFVLSGCGNVPSREKEESTATIPIGPELVTLEQKRYEISRNELMLESRKYSIELASASRNPKLPEECRYMHKTMSEICDMTRQVASPTGGHEDPRLLESIAKLYLAASALIGTMVNLKLDPGTCTQVDAFLTVVTSWVSKSRSRDQPSQLNTVWEMESAYRVAEVLVGARISRGWVFPQTQVDHALEIVDILHFNHGIRTPAHLISPVFRRDLVDEYHKALKIVTELLEDPGMFSSYEYIILENAKDMLLKQFPTEVAGDTPELSCVRAASMIVEMISLGSMYAPSVHVAAAIDFAAEVRSTGLNHDFQTIFPEMMIMLALVGIDAYPALEADLKQIIEIASKSRLGQTDMGLDAQDLIREALNRLALPVGAKGRNMEHLTAEAHKLAGQLNSPGNFLNETPIRQYLP